jgi:hypothetical protein
MEVFSSTEMGAPGASHLGTGDHGPKTDRSRPRSVPVKGFAVLIEVEDGSDGHVDQPNHLISDHFMLHQAKLRHL